MQNGQNPQTSSDRGTRAQASGMGRRLDGSPLPGIAVSLQRIGIAADHGGYELMRHLAGKLRESGYSLVEFGDRNADQNDDYPDYVIPLAEAVAGGDLERGIAICGSGVGASVAANKVPGARACLIHECFSAHQGVEDDDLNVICMGGQVVGHALAWELVQTFLSARFSGAERHCRRLAKVANFESHAVDFMPGASPASENIGGGDRGAC